MVPCGGGSPCPGLPPPWKFGSSQCARVVAGVPVRRVAGASELNEGEVYGLSFSCGSVYALCSARPPV